MMRTSWSTAPCTISRVPLTLVCFLTRKIQKHSLNLWIRKWVEWHERHCHHLSSSLVFNWPQVVYLCYLSNLLPAHEPSKEQTIRLWVPIKWVSRSHAVWWLILLPLYSLTDSAFPYELAGSPKAWIPRLNVNLQFYRRHEYGGHFAALDNPKGLSEDLQEFFAQHYVAWALMPVPICCSLLYFLTTFECEKRFCFEYCEVRVSKMRDESEQSPISVVDSAFPNLELLWSPELSYSNTTAATGTARSGICSLQNSKLDPVDIDSESRIGREGRETEESICESLFLEEIRQWQPTLSASRDGGRDQ